MVNLVCGVMVAVSLSAGPEPAAPAVEPTLPLEAALAELDARSLSLAQARARAEGASALAREAASGLLPVLQGQLSYTRNSADAAVTPPVITVTPGGPVLTKGPTLFIQPLEQKTASASLRVPLLAPNAWFDLAASRDAARAADGAALATRAAVRTGFAQAAYASAAAEEVVGATEKAVANAAELEASAGRRVAAGTAAPLDALKAQTERVRRESDLAQARASLGRARLALGILLGREGPVRVGVPDPAEEPPGAPTPAPGTPPEALAAQAVAHRPEVAAQAAQVDAARAQVRSAWSRLAPTVQASGSIFASDVPYPTGDKDGWRVGVDLTWTLYDGGFRYGKRREAEARLAEARAGAEAERLAVVEEVLNGARDLDLARERLRLAGAQARLAGDAAASARRSFEAGVASSLDVIDANDRLYLADVGLADARARLAQARLAFDRAVGR